MGGPGAQENHHDGLITQLSLLRMLNSSPWGRAGCMAVWRAEHWGGMDRLFKLAMGVGPGCVGISQHYDTQHMMFSVTHGEAAAGPCLRNLLCR